MSKVISITNVKGGVGKSITALFVSRILADKGNKTLLIDMDSQNSLTSFFFEDYSEVAGNTIYEALLNKAPIKDTIKRINESLDFIPASIDLSKLSLSLQTNRDFKLFSLLEHINSDYDYIVIDTPPSLHLETKLALVTSHYVIIPTLLEKWASRSIDIVLQYMESDNLPMQEIVKVKLNKVYILPTMTEKNRKIQDIVYSDLKDKYKGYLLPGISRKTDIQKLSYIGQEFDIKRLEAYGEYTEIVKEIEGKTLQVKGA